MSDQFERGPVFTAENTEGFEPAQLDAMNDAYGRLWDAWDLRDAADTYDMAAPLHRHVCERISDVMTGDPDKDTAPQIVSRCRNATPPFAR